MNRFEKQARIDYLWNKVRLAVITGSSVGKKIEVRREEKRNVIISSDESMALPDVKVLEEHLDEDYEDRQEETDLSWYLVEKQSKCSKVMSVQVQLVTLFSLFVTPLLLAFNLLSEDRDEGIKVFIRIVDISWTINIIFNFFRAD